jgi:general stress protein 26
MDTTATELQKLWALIKDIKFGMFTHRHSNGMLHSQPLTTLNTSMEAGDDSLFFFVSRGSDVARQLTQDNNVNISYTNPDYDCYVSVSGTALVLEDMEKKEALWSPVAKAWFPGGPTDPDLALVQVRISHAEYWDVTHSKMVQVANLITAAVTGTPPSGMGEPKELRMP